MHEVILSVGIDIGTSTTQLIFSRLTIENRASSYTVPRIDIVDKEVIYRSKIYFTPLRSATEIDAEAVKRIVREEYQAAGMTPEMLRTGAVIITGETARKENANEVLEALSDLAGDFVVATAGPDLESVLSARGAGTDALSKEKRTAIANVDIGGGTTGLAILKGGEVVQVEDEPTGGTHLSLVLAGNYHVPFAEAEEIKQDYSRHKEILPVLKAVVEKIATIINRYVKGKDIDTIYLCGGTCCLTGIEKIIEKETGIKTVKPENPFLVTPAGIAMNCQPA